MRWLFILFSVCSVYALAAQTQTASTANYALAARFSPKKLEKMVFSLSVDPHWFKSGDKFWYVYETSEGKKWWWVDALKGEKKPLFDPVSLAAKLTKATDEPMDAQHLLIDSLRLVKDENWLQFEVKSSLEIEKKDSTAKKGSPVQKEKKTFYFEYHLQNGELVELKDFKKPKRRPNWANISPDGQVVLFGKNNNIWWMDV
ncbi:MAG: S9 family peptidase, partial [Sphingobacteriia bacterium]